MKFLKRLSDRIGEKITMTPECEASGRGYFSGKGPDKEPAKASPPIKAAPAKADRSKSAFKAPPPECRSSGSATGSRSNHIADQAIATGSTSVAPIDGSTAVARIQEPKSKWSGMPQPPPGKPQYQAWLREAAREKESAEPAVDAAASDDVPKDPRR